ncbi:MAG: DUF1934 domain-containing protein [Oscillospiraceae bacterium]|nr:DUF1934 domain-containing protein [Oscillospiraceae bacterium]
MDDKKVAIDITSTQFSYREKDVTELFTFGDYIADRKNERYRITYKETADNGFAGSNVTLDIDGDKMVTLNRRGGALANLVIEKGRKHHCHYDTPYGDFMVGIAADTIRADFNDNGGKLYLKYTVDINSSFMSENEMFINIKEVSGGLSRS